MERCFRRREQGMPTAAVRWARPSRSLPILLILSAGLIPCLRAEDALKITSPTDGAVMNPGQTVVLTVSAAGGPFTGVSFLASGNFLTAQVLTAPPYQFSFTVPPPTIPGPYSVTAVGTTASGDTIFSAPVFVDVERSDSPQSISVDHTQLELRIGGEVPIAILGMYSDGSIVDLSNSSQTTYVSQSPGIATVSPGGAVVGVAPGSTKIIVRHQTHQAIVSVVVARNPY